LIISHQLGSTIIPQIVKLRQIISIYIYSLDKKANERWTQNFSQVKCVIDRLDDLIYQIQRDQTEREIRKLDEALSIHVCNSNFHDEGQSSTELNIIKEFECGYSPDRSLWYGIQDNRLSIDY